MSSLDQIFVVCVLDSEDLLTKPLSGHRDTAMTFFLSVHKALRETKERMSSNRQVRDKLCYDFLKELVLNEKFHQPEFSRRTFFPVHYGKVGNQKVQALFMHNMDE